MLGQFRFCIRSVFFIAACIRLTVGALAQEPYPFEEYPAPTSFRGKPAAPILDSPKARLYRTTIRYAAKRGPDFAGHYTIAMWGCGSQCTHFVIIDAQTGRVYVPSVGVSFSLAGPIYRLDSTLLVTEQEASMSGPNRLDYYNWSGSKLVHLKTVRLP